MSVYGADAATSNGTLVDQGAVANTYGAWTEIASASSVIHNGMTVVFGTNKQVTGVGDQFVNFQVAIGAEGFEDVIAEFASGCNASVNRMSINSFEVFAQIPEGTRISMRSKSNLVAASSRQFTSIILGY